MSGSRSYLELSNKNLTFNRAFFLTHLKVIFSEYRLIFDWKGVFTYKSSNHQVIPFNAPTLNILSNTSIDN